MGFFKSLGSAIGVTKGEEKVKTKSWQKPASWKNYPDLKAIHDEFIDVFWGKEPDAQGEGGTLSYRDMLTADHEWLVDAYTKNDSFITELETVYENRMSMSEDEYIKSLSDLADKYERGMKDSEVSVRFGGQTSSMVPQASQRTLGALRSNRSAVDSARYAIGQGAAGRKLKAGQSQADRQLKLAITETPHLSDTAYLNYLQNLSMSGQKLRTSIPSSSGYTAYDPRDSVFGAVGNVLGAVGNIWGGDTGAAPVSASGGGSGAGEKSGVDEDKAKSIVEIIASIWGG